MATAAGGLRRTANALGGREGVMSTECRTLRTPRRAPGPPALRAAAPQDAHYPPGEERSHRQGGDGACPQHKDRVGDADMFGAPVEAVKLRSVERRLGQECVCTCRDRCW